jgi:exodeoxyribonuclease V alpha subunit
MKDELILNKLALSKFRSSFHLKKKDIDYINDKGMNVVKNHAYDFIRNRIGSSNPINDGKQTPMRGHPVFIAQHACACCCRGCLEKWHHIPKGRELTNDEIDYIVSLLIKWIEREYKK